FAFQIYCDFSAYSDIAIGSARLLGLESVINFAHPYFSESPVEFWRRWHISLMNWFRDYVFFPLGGMRRSRLRRASNVLLIFLLSGLWHGGALKFNSLGGIKGGALLAGRIPKRKKENARKVNKSTLVISAQGFKDTAHLSLYLSDVGLFPRAESADR